MDLDALSLAALCFELSHLLLEGRVQRIVQVTPLSYGLELYTGERHQLWISAEREKAGVLLLADKPRRGVESPSPLLLLMRKYIRGARLISIEQPPLERILRFRFAASDGPIDLVCEAMGRLSNLILLDGQGLILDAAKRVSSSINRYRTILPHEPYVGPPPQDKAHPLSLSRESLKSTLEAQKGPLWRRLVYTIAGVGPEVAREIAFRAAGAENAPFTSAEEDITALLETILALLRRFESHVWEPYVGYSDPRGLPTAFAPYEPTHYPRRDAACSMSDAVRRVWEAGASQDAYAQARARLRDILDKEVAKQQARADALRRSRASRQELDRLQLSGSAILAQSWAIEPGQTELEVDPVALGLVSEWNDPPLRVPLDAGLSPAENAQTLFQRYRKLQRADEQIPALLDQTEAELAYLAQLSADVSLANSRAEIDEVEQEMLDAGYVRKTRGLSAAKSGPLCVRLESGELVLVGRNSRQNQQVTFRKARSGDLWLHARGVPGGHVVIKSTDSEYPADVLHKAAQLAAHYSSARDDLSVAVDYTERRHVRPIKGGRPGMVTYSHHKTLTVRPASEDDL